MRADGLMWPEMLLRVQLHKWWHPARSITTLVTWGKTGGSCYGWTFWVGLFRAPVPESLLKICSSCFVSYRPHPASHPLYCFKTWNSHPNKYFIYILRILKHYLSFFLWQRAIFKWKTVGTLYFSRHAVLHTTSFTYYIQKKEKSHHFMQQDFFLHTENSKIITFKK